MNGKSALLAGLVLLAGCGAGADLSRRASADLPSLISTDDYPASAVAAEEEGAADYALAVGPDGRVRECTITSSTGSAALDGATCSLLSRRARFVPARDRRGRPTSDLVRGRIYWALTDE